MSGHLLQSAVVALVESTGREVVQRGELDATITSVDGKEVITARGGVISVERFERGVSEGIELETDDRSILNMHIVLLYGSLFRSRARMTRLRVPPIDWIGPPQEGDLVEAGPTFGVRWMQESRNGVSRCISRSNARSISWAADKDVQQLINSFIDPCGAPLLTQPTEPRSAS